MLARTTEVSFYSGLPASFSSCVSKPRLQWKPEVTFLNCTLSAVTLLPLCSEETPGPGGPGTLCQVAALVWQLLPRLSQVPVPLLPARLLCPSSPCSVQQHHPGPWSGAGTRAGLLGAVLGRRLQMRNNPRPPDASAAGPPPRAVPRAPRRAPRWPRRRALARAAEEDEGRPVPAGCRQPCRAPVWPPRATARHREQSPGRRRGLPVCEFG